MTEEIKEQPVVDTPITVKEAVEWKKKGGRYPKAVAEEVKETNRKVTKAIIKVKRTKKGIRVNEGAPMEAFLAEFLKNGGNATQAALSTGNYSSISSAAQAGSVMLKKAKYLGRIYIEKQGYGYGKMIDVALEKMEHAKKPDWWDRVMKIADYENFFDKKSSEGPVNVNIFNAHKQMSSEYIDGDAEEVTGEVIDGEEVTEDEN